MYKIILNKSARLDDIVLPIAFFNLYVDEPDALICRITMILSPNLACSYASEPLFDMCTSIVAEDSPVRISSTKAKQIFLSTVICFAYRLHLSDK